MHPTIQNLLYLASEDRSLADSLWGQRKYTYAILFSQQAAEKIVKALIFKSTQKEAPRTHNLVDLLSLTNKTLPSHLDSTRLKELSLAYVRTRYEDMSYQYYNDKERVAPLYEFGKAFYLWIHTQLQIP
jgi:HEPN domain-containing protein